MSFDFKCHFYEAVVDSNTWKVFLEAVGDCFSSEVRESSYPLAAKRPFCSGPVLVSLKEHTHCTEIHFWFE